MVAGRLNLSSGLWAVSPMTSEVVHDAVGGQFKRGRYVMSRAAQTFRGPCIAGIEDMVSTRTLVKLGVSINSWRNGNDLAGFIVKKAV